MFFFITGEIALYIATLSRYKIKFELEIDKGIRVQALNYFLASIGFFIWLYFFPYIYDFLKHIKAI